MVNRMSKAASPAPCAESLLPAPQDRGYDTGISPPVHHGDNPKRLFFRGVGNQIFTHQNEAQRSSCEVRTSMARLGMCDHGANAVKDFLAHTARSKWVVFRDVLPNLGNVLRGKRVEAKSLP